MLDVDTLIAVAIPTVGIIVWLVRMEGRINLNDEAIRGMREDLRYVRERIDRALEPER